MRPGKHDAFQAFADAVMRPAGMRVFGADEMTGALERRGLIDLRRDVRGFLQLVGGRKPSGDEPMPR